MENNLESFDIEKLYTKIVKKIEDAKRNAAIKVNSEMTILYWNIGKEITENVLKYEKAEYGKAIIDKISQKLVSEYGRGYGIRNIFRMLKCYDYFPDFEILSTLSTKLSWSHFVELLQVESKIKREFYIAMSMNENWSVRTLKERVASALFERTAISKKPEQTIVNIINNH